jgi:hypothetical protein
LWAGSGGSKIGFFNNIDPKRSISSLHSRRSAKPNFYAMEIYEAVVGGLNLPATTGRLPSLQTGQIKGSSTRIPVE